MTVVSGSSGLRGGGRSDAVGDAMKLTVLVSFVRLGIVTGLVATLLPTGALRAAVTQLTVLPSVTDPAIKTFDVPHFVLVDDDVLAAKEAGRPADRHELLLWLPGTLPPGAQGNGPGGALAFCELAARLGYHVVILKYPNGEPAAVCRRDRSPTAFEEFRMALIAGGKSAYNDVPRAESIENRLVKLLAYLQRARPQEAWSQFLHEDGGIAWERVAVAGQSQGGGHAALIGIKHPVARVICTGSPKDYNLALNRPAAWLGLASATPKTRFFVFYHLQDRQGCSPEQQVENVRALKLDAYGSAVDVDQVGSPYRHSRWLTTDYPGTKVASKTAHGTVISPENASKFTPVWTYLLTEAPP